MKYTATKNMPLLEALSLLCPNNSKTSFRSWIKEGRVKIDESIATTPTEDCLSGQVITVGQRRKFVEEGVEILYDDRDIVVINKPTGLLSVASLFEKGETAHGVLKKYYRTAIHVVHRLDQDTSGVMVFARHEKSAEELKKLFEAHDIERRYVGIVTGVLDPSSGTWKSYLYEDAFYHVHSTDTPEKGRLAITHFNTQTTTKTCSLVMFTLETGRKNQIRVHSTLAGHPIVGDKKYGSKFNPIRRLCLHAFVLAFKHPITHKLLRFESAIPEEFTQVMGRGRVQINGEE
jgi:23S rRNA pseudouridine1911/1915/1917 synthase